MDKTPQKFHTRNVLSVSFAHFIHDVYSSFLAPILPLLIEKLSINYSYAGLLAFSQRVPALFNFILGMHIGRFKIRYFVIFTPGITAVCMSLLGLAPHYIVAVVLLLSMGISGAFFHVPAPVVIKKFSGDRVGRGMSFYMVGGELARTLGPIIILGAVSWWGLEGTYRLIPFGFSCIGHHGLFHAFHRPCGTRPCYGSGHGTTNLYEWNIYDHYLHFRFNHRFADWCDE